MADPQRSPFIILLQPTAISLAVAILSASPSKTIDIVVAETFPLNLLISSTLNMHGVTHFPPCESGSPLFITA